MKLTVSKVLEAILPELTGDEFTELENQILDEGCIDPIIVWKDKGIIVDGHNRYRICQVHDLPFKVKEIAFKDESDAIDWMIRRQTGRRNWSKQQREYAVGKLHEATIRAKGHPPLGDNNDGDTATRVAAQTGVSRRQVFRDASSSKKVDKLAPDVRKKYLAGRLGTLTPGQLERFSGMEHGQQRELVEKVDSGQLNAVRNAVQTVQRNYVRMMLDKISSLVRAIDEAADEEGGRDEFADPMLEHLTPVVRLANEWFRAKREKRLRKSNSGHTSEMYDTSGGSDS